MKGIMDLLGRMCLSLIFFYEAYDSIRHFQGTEEIMTQYGITWRQDLLLVGSICALVLGSVLMLIGYRSSLGAALILMYWIPATFIVHSFWSYPEDMQREQSIHFMKNIAIVGGLFTVLVNGSGKYSIRRMFATSKVRGA